MQSVVSLALYHANILTKLTLASIKLFWYISFPFPFSWWLFEKKLSVDLLSFSDRQIERMKPERN